MISLLVTPIVDLVVRSISILRCLLLLSEGSVHSGRDFLCFFVLNFLLRFDLYCLLVCSLALLSSYWLD